jgi:hypothetical protein
MRAEGGNLSHRDGGIEKLQAEQGDEKWFF